jgi:nucleoside-diphosphate-sugar epimerase
MATILITGGAGFLGSNFAALFVSNGDTVYILDNLITGSEDNLKKISDKVTFINADLTFADLPALLKNQRFDIIFHLASPASPKQYFKYPVETLMVNSAGTKNILDYMLKTKSSTLVYSSTSEVYGDPLEHPQREDYWGNVNSVGPRACYDEAKRFGEALCMTYVKKNNLDIRIARLFNTYGPNMEKEDGRVISNFIVQALEGKPLTIHGDGTQTRSFCFVNDMVDALFRLGTLDIKAGEIVNLGNNDERQIIEIAAIIKDLTKTQSEIIFTKAYEDDPKRRKPDLTKAYDLLQWQPTTKLETGLTKTIEYFKTLFFI